MHWMSPMDASFRHIEGPMNPMHIGGISIFVGATGDYDSSNDIDVLTAGVERAMKELVVLVAPPRTRPRKAKPKPKKTVTRSLR